MDDKESINKFLTEQMGDHWHKWKIESRLDEYLFSWKCTGCPAKSVGRNSIENPDYFTPEGFFALWTWAKGKEWWKGFISAHGDYQMDEPEACLTECAWIDAEIIDPVVFPVELAKFLGWKE
jgi:hypothetical protein